jgi:hypothetical protein
MRKLIFSIFATITLLLPSCQTLEGLSPAGYEYELGLGYGFLDKQVQVSVDGVPVLFLVGNEEMESFAQLQGTNMLYIGRSQRNEVVVSVSVDGNPPLDQTINLTEGQYIHIYLEAEKLSVYNTSKLIFE